MQAQFYLGERTLSRAKPSAAGDTVALNTILAPAVSTVGPKETPGQNTLAYLAPPLTGDLEVTGHPVMNLWMSVNAADADILARIEDVAPDGTSRTYNMRTSSAPHVGRWPRRRATTLGCRGIATKRATHVCWRRALRRRSSSTCCRCRAIFKAGHQLRLVLVFSDPKAPAKPDPSTMVTVLRGPERGSFITLPVIPAGATQETR